MDFRSVFDQVKSAFVIGKGNTFLHGGQRKVGAWLATQRCVELRFDDAAAFFNANTRADLQRPPP